MIEVRHHPAKREFASELHQDSFRREAGQISRSIAEMPPPGDVCQVLERLAQTGSPRAGLSAAGRGSETSTAVSRIRTSLVRVVVLLARTQPRQGCSAAWRSQPPSALTAGPPAPPAGRTTMAGKILLVND